MTVLLKRMKADVRPPIYQTMVLAVPSYQFEAMSRSIRRSNGRRR